MEDSNWINDIALEQGLSDYVPRNLKRKEILDFMKRHYELYYSSIATLDRRLQFFLCQCQILWLLEENIYSFFMKLEHFQDLYELTVVLRLVTTYTYLSCKVSDLDDPLYSVM